MNEQVVNVPLLRKAVEWAEAEAAKPWELSQWYQPGYITPAEYASAYDESGLLMRKSPACGTCYCIAGFIAEQVLGADLDDTGEAWDVAAEALGLSEVQASSLFKGDNTIAVVRKAAESIAGERL